MIRLLFTLFSLTVTQAVMGQFMLPVHQDTSKFKFNNELTIIGVADYQSTSIGKDISRSLFYGGVIDEVMKDESSQRHQLINRFGIDINSEISYRNHKIDVFKDSLKGLELKYGIYNFSSIQYTEDVFDLLFFGNSHFIGDTALLSGSRFDSFTFQKVGFGWFNKLTKSSITFNAIGVHNVLTGYIQKGEIYQSTLVDSVRLEMDGVYKQSNSSFFSGFGFAIDVDYRFNMPRNEKERIYFQLLARNLGVVCLPNINSYTISSDLNYSAYTVDELLNSSTFFSDPQDVSNSLSDSISNETSFRVLPGLLQFTKLVDRSSERVFQGFYGARAYLSSSFMPMFFGGIDMKTNSWYRFGLQASYGGFSNFRWGMYSEINFPRFNLAIASENLFSNTGESLILRMTCAF